MCGVLAVWSKHEPLDAAACRRALSTMAWRGPDFCLSRVWQDRLFLGQSVLSVTGQPEGDGYHRSRSGRFDIQYNGELYNCVEIRSRFLSGDSAFASRTGTDTEMLANLHDVLEARDVAARLDGMFAYVVFDETARTLALARDPQGEKVLYRYEDDAQLVVASEVGAILSLVPGLRPDAQALRDYFRTRHLILGGRTVYAGIREVPPGTFERLELDTGRWTRTRFAALRGWIDADRVAANATRSIDSLADELSELIDRSVSEMLPTDRRYACVVSGGVDSAVIAEAVLRHGNPDLLIAVDSTGKDPLTRDLSPFERVLGRPITAVRVDPAMYAAEIARCQMAAGAPLASHSFVAQAQQAAVVRASGCRVLFGGDGADELFGGYPAYVAPLDGEPVYSPSPYTAHREPLLRFRDDDPRTIQHELSAAWRRACDAYSFIPQPTDRQRLAMMFCDAEHQLPAVGLRSADVMSMMWSVESRSVYLRKPLVQFALNLPAPTKADARPTIDAVLRTKPLLKCLFLRRFPHELLHEKRGFAGFPNESGAWLGDPADYLALDYLGVDRASLAAALGDRDQTWKLINVEYFLRHAAGRFTA
jgi:asparagine synthase (glutamine-hydrolysing)